MPVYTASDGQEYDIPARSIRALRKSAEREAKRLVKRVRKGQMDINALKFAWKMHPDYEVARALEILGHPVNSAESGQNAAS